MKELIIVLILLPIVYAIAGIFYWGIGNFIIFVFGIQYTWTYFHGVAFALVVGILKSIFGSDD